jgi:uncharacterized protein (DUF2384 family)
VLREQVQELASADQSERVPRVSQLSAAGTSIFKSEETWHPRPWFPRLATSARRGAPAVVVTPEEQDRVGQPFIFDLDGA